MAPKLESVPDYFLGYLLFKKRTEKALSFAFLIMPGGVFRKRNLHLPFNPHQVPPKPAPDRTVVPKKVLVTGAGPATPGTVVGVSVSTTGTVLRPTPPPVPPNKPVLQRKDLGPKPPVPPRTVPDSAAQGAVQR